MHRSLGKLVYHKKYTAKELVALMQRMGMKRGSVVCIHASMKEFYNFQGTAEELIGEILNVLGEEGTLVMPAFPAKDLIAAPDYVFDRYKDRTGAGYLAESFRKYPGVIRSINIQHSACAIGAQAEYLTKDHCYSGDCWDAMSPWQRMCESDALIFNLGMPRSYIGTFHHCVESMLQHEHPYWKQFFNCEKTFRYYDHARNIASYSSKVSTLERRTRERNVTKYFTSDDWAINKISNLEVKVFYSKHCLNKMLDLGRKGISVFYVPSPRKYVFNDNGIR